MVTKRVPNVSDPRETGPLLKVILQSNFEGDRCVYVCVRVRMRMRLRVMKHKNEKG